MNDAPASPPSAESPATTPIVLQDWTPLSSCLDWHLGQLAFQGRGAQAFTTHEVPNLIHQGGLAAVRAAEVLFASCAAAEAAGTLEDRIEGMELAIGLGLYTLQLLDRFQRRCDEAGKDWYQRLTWYATDATPRMLVDARDRGVFARHADRVVLCLADGRAPAKLRRLADGEEIILGATLRIVVHTYLLCVLPANVFRRDVDDAGETSWKVMVARTLLRRPELLPRFSATTVERVQAQLAEAGEDPSALLELAGLYPLLDLDLSLASFDLHEHPERAELERVADLLAAAGEPEGGEAEGTDRPIWVLHSGGAQLCIQRTLELLRDDGVLLYRDYGPGTTADANVAHLYQHYGPTTAIGINHVAIDSWLEGGLAAARPVRVDAPEGEQRAAIKTRLVSTGAPESVRTAFLRAFDVEETLALEAKIEEARASKDGATALALYREALRMEPGNWALLGEAAEVALRNARQLELAEVLIREALRINPWSSSAAWNTLGDVLWFGGDLEGAEAAFTRATLVNPEHQRGWFNLYLCARQRAQHARAVEMAAKALAVDRDGEESQRLVAALRDAIERLGEQRQLWVQLRRGRQAGSHR